MRGVRRRQSDLDSTTVQEADLPEASDAAVLDWAAAQGRIVIMHDHRTMRPCAEDRLKLGQPMAGLIFSASDWRKEYFSRYSVDELLQGVRNHHSEKHS